MKLKRKKEMNKLQKGITLIALVITIIILLILAGISIVAIIGDNGIIGKANDAKRKTEISGLEEQINISILEAKQKYRNPTLDNIIDELIKNGVIDSNEQVNKKTGDIESNLGPTISGKLDEYLPPPTLADSKERTFNRKTKVIDDKGKSMPVPGGFKIAEDSATVVEEGVVIEDARINEDGTPTTTTGSQFVWIPVTADNQYVRDKTYYDQNVSEAAKDDENYLPDDLEKKAIEDKTEGDIEKETVVSAGGFYISRYEAGKEGTNSPYTLVSRQGANVWVNIPHGECKVESKKFINNDDVKSGLLTGVQWDVVMKFINGKLDGNNKEFDVKVYNSSNGRHRENPESSGQNEADKVCNIYDLEGNYYEYVAEKSDYNITSPFICRGGGSFIGDAAPASWRGKHNNASNGHSFRFVLYII